MWNIYHFSLLICNLFYAVYTMQVGYFYTACGAVFGTDTEIRAVRAFSIVDDGDIVNNFDSLFGTYTLTFFTADTAVKAVFSCNSTFIMVTASYDNIFCIGDEGDKPVWTSPGAKTAADTACRIDNSSICDNRYGILRTGICTVA